MNGRPYHLVEPVQGMSSHSNGKFCGVIFNKSEPLCGICSLPPRRFFSLKNLAVSLSRTDFEGNSQLKSAERNFIFFFLVEGSPVTLTAITKPAAQRRRFFGPSSHLYLGGFVGQCFVFELAICMHIQRSFYTNKRVVVKLLYSPHSSNGPLFAKHTDVIFPLIF